MKRIAWMATTVAILLTGTSVHADVIWGVTGGTGDNGFWTGGEIFTVDTQTGAVSVKATYDNTIMIAFGDIAVRANGEVYVTYAAGFDDGFDRLAKVNTTTWAFDWVQDLGSGNDQVNALEFIGDTLYGVTGGGVSANLLQFTLTGSGATVSNLGNIGTNSDGDLAQDWASGAVYYTSWEAGNTGELNVIDFGPPPSKTGVEIQTLSGWAGLAFDSSGTLWAGTYWNQNLYTMTTGAAPTATLAYDLSGSLGGTITGLSNPPPIPAPPAVVLGGMGLALVGLTRSIRRKRR